MWCLNPYGQRTTTSQLNILKRRRELYACTFKDSEQFSYTEQCKWIDDVEFWEEVSQTR